MTREQTLAHIRFCIDQMNTLQRRAVVDCYDVAQQMAGLNRMLLEDYIRIAEFDG